MFNLIFFSTLFLVAILIFVAVLNNAIMDLDYFIISLILAFFVVVISMVVGGELERINSLLNDYYSAEYVEELRKKEE